MSALLAIPDVAHSDQFVCPTDELEMALRLELDSEDESQQIQPADPHFDQLEIIYCPHNKRFLGEHTESNEQLSEPTYISNVRQCTDSCRRFGIPLGTRMRDFSLGALALHSGNVQAISKLGQLSWFDKELRDDDFSIESSSGELKVISEYLFPKWIMPWEFTANTNKSDLWAYMFPNEPLKYSIL